eukprot:2999621-Ditylum_brightwellii.AAC.1
MHKLLAKKLAHAKKERDKDGKGKYHSKSESSYKRHHRPKKNHAGKHKKMFYDYHGLCHHDKKECIYYQAYRKHVQPTNHIMGEQRLWQVKDLNTFIKDKINEMIKQCDQNMHAISNFEELFTSSNYESVHSIVRDTSVEDSGDEECKPDSKK